MFVPKLLLSAAESTSLMTRRLRDGVLVLEEAPGVSLRGGGFAVSASEQD